MRAAGIAVVVLGLAACGDDGAHHAGHDAATAGSDAAPIDAARPIDAPIDAVPCPIAADATITGTLQITCDDDYILYVNGVLIDNTPRGWSDPQTYTVTLARNPLTKNVIAIQADNTQEVDGYDRGVIADLEFTSDGTADGSAQSVLTDGTWRLSPTEVTNWAGLTFDDSEWVLATDEGSDGMAPWGDVLGASTASWIWSYQSNGPASAKPAVETVYVRKDFYITTAGTPTSVAPTCP